MDWFPTTSNTAGDLILGSGSEFVQAVETKREILVWTDTSLHSMRFIGPPFTFGLQQLASNILSWVQMPPLPQKTLCTGWA